MIKRIIPSTAEELPVIGLGTWQTFDVDSSKYPTLKKVLQLMHQHGGAVIDSSPMYGRSEKVIGDITSEMPEQNNFFYATKVWIEGREAGIEQLESSMQKMQRNVLDLIQIHNLVDWKTHLKTLRQWKDEGKVRYIGITHYTDSMHEALEKIIDAEPIDFVQFNYSITARNAEKRLLPIAKEKGVATLINRPLGEGKLFNYVKEKPLPAWAMEYGIETWSQYFLKFIVANNAVTCIIPGTSNPYHIADNMKAGEGDIPDQMTQQKMADYLLSL
jgi:diketogulonate reductase-like aldo/keto reductase